MSGGDQEVNISLDADTRQLADVIVTASKRSERLQDVPGSIQAITPELIQQTGIRDAADVTGFVPGASEDLGFGAGAKQFQLRGIPQEPGDPAIGYYLDDIPFNFFGFRYAPLGRTFDVERVEVLRGPQSTLYGAGAMGGVMKFVSKAPNLNKVEGAALAGGTTLEGGDQGYYGDLAVNVPIIQQKLGVRVTVGQETLGGYSDNNAAVFGETAENINDTKNTQIRAQILYQPLDKLQIKASYLHNASDQNAGLLLSQLDPEVSLPAKDDFVNVSWRVFSGTIKYDLGFATATSTTSTIKNDQDQSTTINLGGFLGIGIFSSFGVGSLKGFNHETRLASNGEGPFNWTAGVYYVQSDAESKSSTDPVLALFPASSNLSESVSPSFFGEVSYSFLDDKFTFLAGLRYFRDERTFTESSSSFDPTSMQFVPFTFKETNTFTSVNPRFNLAYRPNEETNIYFNVAKGFRGGKFNSNSAVAEHTAVGLPVTKVIESDQIWKAKF